MNHRKRLSRLEKLAAPVIERMKKGDEAARQKIHDSATVHAVNFAVIAVYGEPKLREPLAETWPRCIQSPALQDFKNPRILQMMTPFDIDAGLVASYLDEHWVSTLPGNTEKEKFDPIFSNAPPWLLWFTFADWTANVLKLALPDLSEMKKFDRSIETLHRWPCLPEGKFELRPRRAVQTPDRRLNPGSRALIRWRLEDLAEASGVGVATIRRAKLADGKIAMTVPT